MKVYKTQAEVEKDIKNGVLTIEGDVKFECPISINASIRVVGDIKAGNINAWNINAGNINAREINAWDINARNINAGNIDAGNIKAREINAGNIDAGNINAWNINAGNINAREINAWDIDALNITYWAFCCVYKSIKCLSIKARRVVHHAPICLEGELTIVPKEPEVEEMTVEQVCKALGKNIKIIK